MIEQELTSKFLSHLTSIYGPLPSPTDPLEKLTAWQPAPLCDAHRGRYLWTDSFAILDLITLSHLFPNDSQYYLTLAKTLHAYITSILSTTHSGPPYTPLPNGGLRIGKPSDSGPDQDGQYFHYLMVYLFALNRLSIATGDGGFNATAMKMAKSLHQYFTAHSAFPGTGEGDKGRLHIVWKLDETLKIPLSGGREGNVDPILGYSVFRLLRERARELGDESIDLSEEINQYGAIVDEKLELGWKSTDMLDVGMTLWVCHWWRGEAWADELCERAVECVGDILTMLDFKPHHPSLAFRDYGACLGLKCYASTLTSTEPDRSRRIIVLAEGILEAWEKRREQEGGDDVSWLKPITAVMHCAALIPGAFMKGFFNGQKEQS